MRRHLLFALCGLSLTAVIYAHLLEVLAQGKAKAPAAPPQGTQAPANSSPTPQIIMPSAETVLVLIRSTLLSLNDALRTGNYTVPRDLGAPSFRDANSAGQLYQIFADLAARGIDLSAVTILAPQIPETPNIDANGHLRIKGYFPGQPVRIDFELLFQVVDRQWRLLALSVTPVTAPSAVSIVPEPDKTVKKTTGR